MNLYQPTISGSLTVSGSVEIIGPFTMSGGSITGTASFASNSGLLSNLDSGSFVGTGSFNTMSSSVSTRVTRIEGNYATTGSNIFTGAQTVCANITSTGTIIAQTLNVQQVTSSVVYSSGSNIFGCSLANTQQFTGSVTMTGSLTVTTAGTSPEFQVGVGGTVKGNALTDVHQVTGSLRITGSVIGVGNACMTSVCSPAFVGGTVTAGGDIVTPTRVASDTYNGYTGGTTPLTIQTGGSQNVVIGTNTNARLTITSTGIACFACSVGIGTSPSGGDGVLQVVSCAGIFGDSTKRRSLSVQSTTAENADQPGVVLGYDTAGAGIVAARTNSSGQPLAFWTYNGSAWGERMRITSGGVACFACQVCAPRFQADNYGLFRASGFRGGLYTYDAVVGSGTDYGVTIFAEGGANNGNIYFAPGGSATKAVTITCFGEMLINTTTDFGDYKLQVNGNIAVPGSHVAISNGTQSANTIAARLYLGNRGYFTDPATAAAMITSKTEGTFWYSGTAMEFYTTPGPDATSNTPQLRMTINKDGNIGAPSGTNIYNASDLRLKRNISNIADGLSKIMCLNPVKFNWIKNYIPSEENKDMLGFIAQEIQNIIPEAVETFASGNSITVNDVVIDSPLRVNEKFIIPVLVRAIQEQQSIIDLLKTCLGIA